MPPSAPLLDSKFHPAVSAAAVIERARLDLPPSFLDGAIKVAALAAPAGYGKSTILARWQKQLSDANIRIAWLNLDESDNDPSRFIRYLTVALLGQDALGTGDSSEADEESEIPELEALAARLTELDERICLVLDDVHSLDNPNVLSTIHWLTHYAPDTVQLLLSGRTLSQIRLSRLRVRRQLVSVTHEDLKFTADEVSDFLQARNVELNEQDRQTLLERTEGWPAGLELAAILLEDHHDPRALIARFCGSEDNVIDYLGEVLVDRMTPEQLSFMYQIAQFRRINADLAARATGCTNSEQRLDELHRGNVFLDRMDGQGQWFRFHDMVRDFLREQGRQDDPNGCAEALLRGAQYYYEEKQIFEAISCAFRARAWETAAAWLAEHIEDLTLNKGYLQSVMDWIAQLPTEWTNRYPNIRLQYAFSLTFFGRHRDTAEHLQQLELTLKDWQSNPAIDAARLDQLERDISAQKGYYYGLIDDRERALTETESWLERWPDVTGDQRAGISNVLTFAYNAFGRQQEARKISDQMLRWIPAHTAGHFVYSWCFLMRCLIFLKSGDFQAAKRTAEDGLAAIPRITARNNWLNKGALHAFLAFVSYESGELEAAENHMDMALTEDENYVFADQLLTRHITQARLLRRRGDTKEALNILNKGRALSEGLNLVRPAISLVAEQITWHVRDGQLEQARELASRYGLDRIPSTDEYDLTADKCLRTAVRCQMHERPQEALKALDAGIEHARIEQRDHRMVELLLLKALLLQDINELDQAVASVIEALCVSAVRGYYQVLRDEGDELLRLLKHVKLPREAETANNLLKRLLQTDKTNLENASGGSNAALIEPLTKRELQILSRLSSDLSNREIAEAIFISEGTLKWHLHNIYGKLAVKTRSGAVDEARKLSLI